MQNEELDGQLHLANIDPLHNRQFTVRKRDGRIVPFDETRISLALESAFKASAGLSQSKPLPEGVESEVLRLTRAAVKESLRRAVRGDGGQRQPLGLVGRASQHSAPLHPLPGGASQGPRFARRPRD